MDKALVKEIKKIAIGVSILGAAEAVVVLLAFGTDAPKLLGVLLGCLCAVLNFVLTARDIQKNIEKAENAAKLAAMGGYYLRLALIAGVVLLAIKQPWLDVYTTVIPLVFPRIVILVCGLLGTKKSGGVRG